MLHDSCLGEFDLLHTCAGEYISPEYIESVLITAPAVEQIFVTGQSDKSSIVAVVVPSLEAPEVINSSPEGRRTFCDSRHAHDLVFRQLGEAGAAAKLKVRKADRCVTYL